MKVLLINGSPNKEGNTYTALAEVGKEIEKQGVEAEIVQIGTEPIRGCVGCGGCMRKEAKGCVYEDVVSVAAEKMASSDGLIIGTPVHYAAAGGAITSFADRFFYSARGAYAYKPAAAVAVARRGGAVPAFDQLNKYFGISNMPIVPSSYWNIAFGQRAGQAGEDLEGMHTMRVLGRNMVWMLRCIEAGVQNGVGLPEKEAKVFYSYIR